MNRALPPPCGPTCPVAPACGGAVQWEMFLKRPGARTARITSATRCAKPSACMAGARASARSCTWVKSTPASSATGSTRRTSSTRTSSTRTTAAQADGPRPGPGLSDRAAGAAAPLIRTAPIPYTYTKIPHPAPFPRSPNRHASSPSVRRFRIRIRICCSVRGGAGEAHGRRGPAGRMSAGRPTTRCRRHDADGRMPTTRCRRHDADDTMPTAGCRRHDADGRMPSARGLPAGGVRSSSRLVPHHSAPAVPSGTRRRAGG